MPFSFHPLNAAQIPEIAQLWYDGWQDGHADIVPPELTALRTLDSFTTRLRHLIPDTYIGTKDGQSLGFYILKGDELYQFYTAPRARGTGFSQAQMQHACQTLKARGHSAIWLSCSVGNTRAARFYEKCGWTNSGVEATEVDITGGTFTLDCWRYETTLP